MRQTKLTSGAEKNSLEVTKPSPFAEGIEPIIPDFNANPKKPGGGKPGGGRKRGVKAEPAEAADTSLKEEGSTGDGEEKANEAKLEPLDVLVAGGSKKPVKATTAAPAKKKPKTKSVVQDVDVMEIEDSDDMDVRTNPS